MKKKPNILQEITISISIISALISILIFVQEFIKLPVITNDFILSILGSIIGMAISIFLGLILIRIRKRKIFISYSIKDLDFVEKISEDLNRNDFQVVKYNDALLVGDNIRDKLEQSISKADSIVVVLSKKASESPWISEEIALAQKHNKVILPVLRENVKLPPELSLLYYADFTNDYENPLNLLIKSLKSSPLISKEKQSNSSVS